MVIYHSQRDPKKMRRFYLLEESPQARDTFIQSMRVLRVYGNTTKSSGNTSAADVLSEI
jgi:hypothetical protein